MKKLVIEDHEEIDVNDTTLGNLIFLLEEYRTKYGEDAYFSMDAEYDDYDRIRCFRTRILFQRNETDIEYDKRVKTLKIKREQRKAAKLTTEEYERKLLQKLKEKYEK
jgi:hypothetical protein